MSNFKKLVSNLAKDHCPSSFGLEDINREGKDKDDCIHGIKNNLININCIRCFQKSIGLDEEEVYNKVYDKAIENMQKILGRTQNEKNKNNGM